MKNYFSFRFAILFALAFLFCATCFSCKKNHDNNQQPESTWDIDKDGVPKFMSVNYLELDKIYRISKFRSSAGHDFSDAFEHCRSMKHYFEPKATTDWASLKIVSPANGTIAKVETEWAGIKLEIVSDDYPAFRFMIFHINTAMPFNVGDKVTAGQQLGTHIGIQTMSDISIWVNDPTKQGRMVSYFDAITDEVFAQYQSRGINSREDMIITKALRDANPLTCSNGTFTSADPLESWVNLN
ncbi:hypothetical protein C7N43_11070 [Sphingobacteriales bacterium UPWRP_1]|nr:hypothetical protein B6N25_12800 [Sphingobacteriales bacterium TSM_CSS]PSJ76969.1 hypothetical protein C7N43_11070 [Sphingobacteriales bacterium UPWRP_1]